MIDLNDLILTKDLELISSFKLGITKDINELSYESKIFTLQYLDIPDRNITKSFIENITEEQICDILLHENIDETYKKTILQHADDYKRISIDNLCNLCYKSYDFFNLYSNLGSKVFIDVLVKFDLNQIEYEITEKIIYPFIFINKKIDYETFEKATRIFSIGLIGTLRNNIARTTLSLRGFDAYKSLIENNALAIEYIDIKLCIDYNLTGVDYENILYIIDNLKKIPSEVLAYIYKSDIELFDLIVKTRLDKFNISIDILKCTQYTDYFDLFLNHKDFKKVKDIKYYIFNQPFDFKNLLKYDIFENKFKLEEIMKNIDMDSIDIELLDVLFKYNHVELSDVSSILENHKILDVAFKYLPEKLQHYIAENMVYIPKISSNIL